MPKATNRIEAINQHSKAAIKLSTTLLREVIELDNHQKIYRYACCLRAKLMGWQIELVDEEWNGPQLIYAIFLFEGKEIILGKVPAETCR